jgi:hypothetical protein
MLKLTHGRKSDERVSSSDPWIRTTAEASFAVARHGALTVGAPFSYWQLRALASRQGNGSADFSERFRQVRTLEADWFFCRAGSMKWARAGLTGPLERWNSV